MNKNNIIISIAMSVCLILITLFATESTVFAATTPLDTADIISALEDAQTPYFGNYGMDFDVTGDGAVDIFDLGILKQKLLAGEPGITEATVNKLECWILNKPDATLEIEYLESIELSAPNEKLNRAIENLTSHDFRFITVEGFHTKDSTGALIPAAYLYFLGIDEYVCESIRITNFCETTDELDECIVNSDQGICIGIKNNVYTLVLYPKNSSPEVEEYDIGPAYVKYDLTTPSTSDSENLVLANNLKKEFNHPYTLDIKKEGTLVTLFCKRENDIIKIIIPESTPKSEMPIYWNDEFYIFYMPKKGFGICFE